MKKLILVLGLAFLAGCGGLEGDLSVQTAFRLIDKSGRSLTVPAGDHQVTLGFNESRKQLTIDFKNLDGKKRSITAETSKSFKIPEQGTFTLAGKDFGQQVDLLGDIRVKRTRTDERWGQQMCQYYTYDTVCTPTECHQVYVQRTGYQDIRYYLVKTDRNTVVNFRTSGTEDEVAQFHANESFTNQNVTWQGICR